jgi:hypothetical protein
MIKQFTINGEKYSLHIKDAAEQNGKAIVRYSNRDTDAVFGVPVLLPLTLTVDEVVDILREHFGVEE